MQAWAPSLDKLRRPRILTALDLQGAVRIYSCECLLIKFPKSRPEHTDSGSKDSLSTIKTKSRALPASDIKVMEPSCPPIPHQATAFSCLQPSLRHSNMQFYFTMFEPQALMTFHKAIVLEKWLDLYMKVTSHQRRAKQYFRLCRPYSFCYISFLLFLFVQSLRM